MANVGWKRVTGLAAALLALSTNIGFAGQAMAKNPSLAAPDERIGKDIHSISPGNLNDPGFGAAVAQRFFPSQTSVFLSAHSDTAWPDALTIGPVAGKQAKPMFITTADGNLPGPDAAYVRKHIKDITVLGGPQVVSQAVEQYWQSQGKTVHRIAGSNRYDTAAQIAATYWPNGSTTVILARGDNPADAISGQPLGTKLNAPILLAEPGRLPAETQRALAKLRPKRIIVLGGEEGIGSDVLTRIASSVSDARVQRVAGETRFETSQRIASEYFPNSSELFAGLNHTPNDGTTLATGQWADMFQLAPAAGVRQAPLVLHPAIHHYLATPIAKTVYAYDPGTKIGLDFYEHQPLWGNVDLAWREAALIRAKAGLPTKKSCTGTFESRWQGYGGPTHSGDGSIWTNGWSAAIFATSPGHLKVLTSKDSDYIRVIAQTLRESHGDNYELKKPNVSHLMNQRGLSIRVGTCVPNGKTPVSLEQRRIGPNTLSP
ncbi:cell wall-binding repeat-containing protein [Stomatohabitans albus]|uniref:cell wall-binding repeat-containing protein n=2 Tax=Stomatohabitans albus TaxID=3110766 RepID=UPI00300C02A8